MELIDTHAHIYLPEFQDDLEMILQRAGEAAVSTVIMPAIDASTHQQMLQIQEVYANCLSMIGLHPCSVNQDYMGELETVKDLLSQRSFKAIGEIGLDFYWDKTFTDQQYEAFHRQIDIAATYNLPIVIHSRSAIDECIAVVREHPGVRGVFHCFSGNEAQGKQIMDLGFYLGIGGVVSFKNGGLDKVLPQLGLSQVVLETDAPYLAPVPYRGKRNEPAYTRLVAEKLASVMGMELEEVANITTANAKKLFSLGEQ